MKQQLFLSPAVYSLAGVTERSVFFFEVDMLLLRLWIVCITVPFATGNHTLVLTIRTSSPVMELLLHSTFGRVGHVTCFGERYLG